MRCCLSFFSLVCIAALGAGFWGNHLVHEETDKFVQATQQMARLVDHAQTQVQVLIVVFQKMFFFIKREGKLFIPSTQGSKTCLIIHRQKIKLYYSK